MYVSNNNNISLDHKQRPKDIMNYIEAVFRIVARRAQAISECIILRFSGNLNVVNYLETIESMDMTPNSVLYGLMCMYNGCLR